jgi:hypothetical protein
LFIGVFQPDKVKWMLKRVKIAMVRTRQQHEGKINNRRQQHERKKNNRRQSPEPQRL